MNNVLPNPFNVTKATDLSDDEIHELWVDLAEGGFTALAKPASPVSMFILGGKGSGKTHVMRYFSYALQKRRVQVDILTQLRREGYIGVYVRCDGVNAPRFDGRGQSEETWSDVFAYFMELWLGILSLEVLTDALLAAGQSDASNRLADALHDVVPTLVEADGRDRLIGLTTKLRELQLEVDDAIRNAAITRSLSIDIKLSRGQLIFGIPRAVEKSCPELKKVQILYLIDEFENLAAYQQKYVNTLVREREGRCSFKVGARLYGIRTYDPIGGETNKEGSEYEVLRLDSLLRKNPKYLDFAIRLCAKRLTMAGYGQLYEHEAGLVEPILSSHFEIRDEYKFIKELVAKDSGMALRPSLNALHGKLVAGLKSKNAHGIKTEGDVDTVVKLISESEDLLLEKANIYLLYQSWFANRDLKSAAKRIRVACKEFKKNPKRLGRHKRLLGHFRMDFIAQLLREFDQKQAYIGFRTFVEMSDGLPRNLLIILKNIYKWAVFNGEKPFQGGLITILSQQQGVKEAAEFFFEDVRVGSIEGEYIRDAVKRIADLLRDIRFSDKPSECSLCAFSTDMASVTPDARRILEAAVQWSLLVRIEGGQRDKNRASVDYKYQLNRMLSPRWDLPISRRGTLALAANEVNAIFDPGRVEGFKKVRFKRVSRMNAPYFGRKGGYENGTEQPNLPGI